MSEHTTEKAQFCSCGNRFDGDNLCMPSACQWEGIEHEHEWVQQIGPGMTSRHVCSLCRVPFSPGKGADR